MKIYDLDELIENEKELVNIEFRVEKGLDINDLDKEHVIGTVTVRISKKDAANVLGENIPLNTTVKLNIPNVVQNDLLSIWKKLNDLL
jgi:hypothetical protein